MSEANFADVDEYVAANVREHREARGLSQDDLAERMTERGFGFSQATIWKIEQGKRPVKISEVIALADALELIGWTALVDHPASSRAHAHLLAAHRRAAAAYAATKEAAAEYLDAQVQLAWLLHEAAEGGVAVSPLWKAWLSTPAERAVLEARIEAEQEGSAGRQIDDAVNEVIQALRARGYEPILDADGYRPAGPQDVDSS